MNREVAGSTPADRVSRLTRPQMCYNTASEPGQRSHDVPRMVITLPDGQPEAALDPFFLTAAPQRAESLLEWRGVWILAAVNGAKIWCARDILEGRGFKTFIPHAHVRTPRGNRNRPIMPGYVPVCDSNASEGFADWWTIGRSYGVYATTKIINQDTFVRQLESFRIAHRSCTVVDLYPGLAVGARVIIKRGPKAGLEGVIDANDAPDVISINIPILFQRVVFKFDPADVELID